MSDSILMGNRWPLNLRVQIICILWILLGKGDFVLLMKAQITRKRINVPKLSFRQLGFGGYQQLIAIFNLVKIKKNNKVNELYLLFL